MSASVAAASFVAGAAAYRAASAADRRRVSADPEWALLRDPPNGRVVPVTGAHGDALHVEVFGPEDAPPIVFAHGWMCSLTFWTRQIQMLSDEYRLIAYDLRGHGRSEEPEGGDYSIDALADDLDLVLRATVDPARPAIVAGHSMGAMQLGAYVQRHSMDRIAAAAFINTGLGDLTTEALIVRLPGSDGLRKRVGRLVMGATVPFPNRPSPISHRAVRYVALSPEASAAQVAFCENMVLQCGPGPRAGFGRAMSEMELHDALEHVAVPALVITGVADKLTPPVHAERLAEALPNVHDLVELEGIGHMGPVEAAVPVTRALRGLASAAWTTASSPSPAASPS